MTSTYQESVEKTIMASEQLRQIVNGSATTEVLVQDGSKIPSVRKVLVDNFCFKEPLAWQQGQDETVFNQLRKTTDGLMWYAPNASTLTPVHMGAEPTEVSGWKVYSLDAIVKLKPVMALALSRTLREAGLNLTNGSFEDGGSVNTAQDVLVQSNTGRCFIWQGVLPKIVPAMSTPQNSGGIGEGKWNDVTFMSLRNQREYTNGVNYIVHRAFKSDVTLTGTRDTVQFSEGGMCYRWDNTFPSGGILIPRHTPEPTADKTGAGKYVAVVDLNIVNTLNDKVVYKFKTAIDMINGIPYVPKAGDVCITEGYHTSGDGAGATYAVRVRQGGYGQNGTVILPLAMDELQAVPTVDVVTASIAGITPAVANLDNTKRFNDLVRFAVSRGQKYVEVPERADYYVADELAEMNNTVLVGESTIVSPAPNNYYKRIFPKFSSKGVANVNSVNKATLARFLNAVKNRASTGVAPVVVFAGDSLTQGGHRLADNYWWVKQLENQLVEQFGTIVFYNRGIAGSSIFQVDSVVQTSSPINAPYEPRWNNTPDKLYRDYIAELNPDMVIMAYGMNSAISGSESAAIVTARNNLRTLMPTTDFVWVTTPIRTTDTLAHVGGNYLGTYPRNEQSNTAGLVTRYLAKQFGDYCIDVNRMSNIVQLGQDPECSRMNRWAGQYRDLTNKFSNPSSITVESDGRWTVNLSNYGEIVSTEMFRDSIIEFTVSSAGGSTVDDLRVALRQDVEHGTGLMLQFTNTGINLIGYKNSSGVQATWNVNPLNKRFRIEAIGANVQLYIDNVKTAPTSGSADGLIGSMFLAPIAVTTRAAGSVNTKLVDFVVTATSRNDYEKYTPALTPFEIFSIQAGDGGNGVNHPNTLGELAMYSQPVVEFVSDCAMLYSDINSTHVVSIGGSQGSFTLNRRGDIVILAIEDFTVSGNDGSTPITVLPVGYLPRFTTSSILGNIALVGDSKRVQVRTDGGVYITGGTGSSKYSGQVVYSVV